MYSLNGSDRNNARVISTASAYSGEIGRPIESSRPGREPPGELAWTVRGERIRGKIAVGSLRAVYA